jgi:hypothetical protein
VARPRKRSRGSTIVSTCTWHRIHPTYEVVSQQLHDECRILVRLFTKGIKLRDGIIESLLGKVASLIRRVEDLVVKDGEVEGETKADGVGGGEIGLSDFGSSLVSLERLVCRLLALVGSGELSEIAVVVALPTNAISSIFMPGVMCLHLVIEDFRLAGLSRSDQVLVEHFEDIFADLSELGLDLGAVLVDELDLGRVSFRFFLLLYRGDDSPRSTTSTDDVLVGDGEEVSLFDREFLVCGSHHLHVLNHFCVHVVSSTRVQERSRSAYLHSARLAQQALRDRQTPRHPL